MAGEVSISPDILLTMFLCHRVTLNGKGMKNVHGVAAVGFARRGVCLFT